MYFLWVRVVQFIYIYFFFFQTKAGKTTKKMYSEGVV